MALKVLLKLHKVMKVKGIDKVSSNTNIKYLNLRC